VIGAECYSILLAFDAIARTGIAEYSYPTCAIVNGGSVAQTSAEKITSVAGTCFLSSTVIFLIPSRFLLLPRDLDPPYRATSRGKGSAYAME
jgi:hypothetical protein